MDTFESRYGGYLSKFNEYLNEYIKGLRTTPELLGESMAYSLQSGGKRIRPVLLLAMAEVLGVADEDALPFALALEMIHTYSLVHDDLPAMDDDDFRRGKPSNHKKFGEGNAVLAGDSLLNTAYMICFGQCLKSENAIRAASILCDLAGIDGMIAGQSADLAAEGKNALTEEDLLYIYENKTGKLLFAPVAIASILSGNKHYFELERFGYSFGMLFQITDDILDVEGEFEKLGKTIGKDQKANKFTSVSLYGVVGAKIRADMYANDCYAVLDGIDGDTTFLRELITFVRNRES